LELAARYPNWIAFTWRPMQVIAAVTQLRAPDVAIMVGASAGVLTTFAVKPALFVRHAPRRRSVQPERAKLVAELDSPVVT